MILFIIFKHSPARSGIIFNKVTVCLELPRKREKIAAGRIESGLFRSKRETIIIIFVINTY